MADTVVLYDGDGSTTQFTYPFDSLSETYVVTTVYTSATNDDVTSNFTVSLDYDTSTVTLSPAPAASEQVEIKRATSIADDIFSFPAGTVMKPADLERSLKTVRDYSEESADQISTDLSSQTAAADVSVAAAAASAAAAATSATNAATSETNAGTSETNAGLSETAAASSATSASTSATAAGTSETNAATSATNAATSETNAATSATNAATSETNAAASEANAGAHVVTAAGSAASAGSSATAAAGSATAAATSETNASTSETNAAGSASAAATSASNASTSETNAAGSASAAAASASNASTSETNAAGSASAAAASATNAATSAANAATSETNAGTSATNAAGSASSAGTSATAAGTSATAAGTSATAAATSATNAATSETNAGTSETNAAASATAAATSETNAAASETAAATSETNAGTSATAAATSATSASTSATNAATSETNAAGSATAAATSATNAATSEANAATSETNAAGSATAAATSATNAATSETNAATSETNAAASETAAATSETNAATSETNAAGSATAAATSAANAATSETNAAGSATAAATSETNAATSASNAATSETNAATSASSASSSQTAAASSATAAATSASSASSSATLAASNAAAIDLSSLSETINDTAVDVFVYDTSKDSDGGAWRHRTQHTSWYNEGASSTRGSRKEFPAVAVIVAETDKVTIYDGDDPSLPMWMVFTRELGWVGGNGDYDVRAISAVNGIISFCSAHPTYPDYGGVAKLHFVADTAIYHGKISGSGDKAHGFFKGGLSTASDYDRSSAVPVIVSGQPNDVAMTVLPDAPTDPATGLPVPTIAVATDGGVSVIKDDGTVVDSASTLRMGRVVLDTEGVWYWRRDATYSLLFANWSNVNAGDGFGGFVAQTNAGNMSFDLLTRGDTLVSRDSGLSLGGAGAHLNAVRGLMLHQPNYTDQSKGMSSLTTSDYATGWMPGDIKMAALADTTAETFGDAVSGATVSDPNLDGVYDGEHVTNGGFDTDSDWTKAANWTISGGQADAVNTSNGDIYQTITTVVGKTYVLSCDIPSTFSGITAVLQIRNSANTATIKDTSLLGVSTSASLTFVATSTVHFVRVYTAVASGSIDNISVKLADPDRSVNGKGLGVHGSITKAPVATGADVVAYSGFSSSNYLEQPYNADLDFGTGDFCVMGWANTTDTYATFVRLADSAGGNPKIFVGTYPSPTAGNLDAYILGTSVLRPNVLTPTGWFHWALVRTNGQATLYANSAPLVSVASVTDLSLTGTETLRIGVRPDGQQTLDAGSLALLRISATAPTADQIRKIYEDEKVLFQPNAKATLTGSSDAVTALAHDPDTELLHVGTPGGRSVFQGLRRVEEHTGTNSQSLAAISAVDGLVVEGK